MENPGDHGTVQIFNDSISQKTKSRKKIGIQASKRFLITRTDGSSTGSDHKRSDSRVPSLGSTRRSKSRMSSMVLSRGEMPPCTQNRLRTDGQRAVEATAGAGMSYVRPLALGRLLAGYVK